MADSYSSLLRAILQVNGENSGTWGQKVNTNIGTILEEAIAGVATVSMTDANYTLTTANGSTDEARKAVIILTGALTATRNVVCPTAHKVYVVYNNTSGGQSVVFKTSSGSGITITNGTKAFVFCDGTNVVEALTFFSSLSIGGALAVGTNLTVGGTASITGAVTLGTALAVAQGGTGATSAANARTNLGLGTMATQNANAVSITGGSATGLTSVSATTVTGTSDERLKDNIRSVVGALDMVKALDGKHFDWKETGKADMGLIAQELERVAPELVVTDEDGIKRVNYFGVVAILVSAVKELAAK